MGETVGIVSKKKSLLSAMLLVSSIALIASPIANAGHGGNGGNGGNSTTGKGGNGGNGGNSSTGRGGNGGHGPTLPISLKFQLTLSELFDQIAADYVNQQMA